MNQITKNAARTKAALGAAFLAALLPFAGCGGGITGGGSVLYIVRSTKKATAAANPVTISGRWLVYLADEATTQSGNPAAPTNLNVLNTDPDTDDEIAVVVDMLTQAETTLNVAARAAAVIGDHIYLVVEESEDTWDWDQDGLANDRVLLHYPGTSGVPSLASVNVEFVDKIESSPDTALLSVSGRLYYLRDDSTGIPNGTTALAYIETSAPTTFVAILHLDGSNSLRPRILGADEKLLFLYQDEAVEGRNLNGDGDVTPDDLVLALLDTTDIAAVVLNTALAIKNDSSPFRAKSIGAGDWLVAFLVGELAQDVNLNAAGLFPGTWLPQCTLANPFNDTDKSDQVLHFLGFADWEANPMTRPPKNTGLAGNDRVIVVGTSVANGAVGTIAKETEDGGCDLNANGDVDEEIARWVRTVTTDPATKPLPYGNSTELVAIDDAAPGGTRGFTDIDNKLLAVVDELEDERDHDLSGFNDHKLLAWLDPSQGNSAAWTYDHNSTASFTYFGITWMAERAQRDKVLVAFQESVFGLDVFGTVLNPSPSNPPNSPGDNDKVDSIPAFGDFDPTGDLDFFWPPVAVDPGNAGVAIANGVLFYRVDELADGREWGGALLNDKILFRTGLGNPTGGVNMGVLNNLSGPGVQNQDNVGAAYIEDESAAGLDFNGDNDTNDLVLRWFRVG